MVLVDWDEVPHPVCALNAQKTKGIPWSAILVVMSSSSGSTLHSGFRNRLSADCWHFSHKLVHAHTQAILPAGCARGIPGFSVENALQSSKHRTIAHLLPVGAVLLGEALRTAIVGRPVHEAINCLLQPQTDLPQQHLATDL